MPDGGHRLRLGEDLGGGADADFKILRPDAQPRRWVFRNELEAYPAPVRLLGRVVSLWSFAGGMASVMALPTGLAGEVVGLRWALAAVSVVLLSITLLVAVRLPVPRISRQAHDVPIKV